MTETTGKVWTNDLEPVSTASLPNGDDTDLGRQVR